MRYGYSGNYGGQPQMGSEFASAQMPDIHFAPVDPEAQRERLKLLGLDNKTLDKMFSARSEINAIKQDFKSSVANSIMKGMGGGGEAIKSMAGGAGSALMKAL